MYDLTTMQLHHRIDEYHRMRTRMGVADRATTAPARRAGMRVIVARVLLSLATRIAPPSREQRTA